MPMFCCQRLRLFWARFATSHKHFETFSGVLDGDGGDAGTIVGFRVGLVHPTPPVQTHRTNYRRLAARLSTPRFRCRGTPRVPLALPSQVPLDVAVESADQVHKQPSHQLLYRRRLRRQNESPGPCLLSGF